MAPTFYGVLGVGPDADAEAIERGYRERVTEVHPDVNDDPDADAQFKRLTTARDTLLDADERSRYDRLGHASYVRHHVSCSAWKSTVSGRGGDDDAEPTARSRPSTSSTSPSDRSTDRRRRTERSGTSGRSRTGDWNTGRRQSDGDDATGGYRSGPGRDRETGSAAGRSPEAGATSGSAKTEGARDTPGGSGTPGESGASADTDGSSWSAGAGGTSRRGSSTGHTGDAGGGESTYASSSFWESQRVGQRFGPRGRTRDPLSMRLLGGVRALGVWALIHVAFLAAAIGTSWYVYVVILDASSKSLPLLVVLVGEVVLAAALSSIHVATRVYR